MLPLTKLDNSVSDLLNIGQAARILGVHTNTLRNWERQEKISSIRIGRRGDRRYRYAELLTLLSSATKDSSTATATPDQTKQSDIRPDELFQLIGQQCLSLYEAAGMTGYHEDYLSQRVRLGELKAIKIGRNWITLRSCLDDFCKTHSGPYPHWSKIRRRKKPNGR